MELLPDTYEVTDNFADADAVLVRSASMHDLELSDNLLAVAVQVQVSTTFHLISALRRVS